ncbi:hypothetical protein QAD02_013294 [Eretmocerus hayati]|uniref:Uncharacterized protein n=1 Tax=Eretmocerus hayati TaxID=131215 RepID=A0ACC2P2B6_9HYME|nr:hypothetical protein QAD02_013294 [Eretmocerus hayati]
MADFGMETLPPVKGHKFSIVLLQLTVMLVNAIDRLHKGGVAITKYWVHVFMDAPSVFTSACATAFLDRHLIRPQTLNMQRLEKLRRGIYYLHQRDATDDEIPTSDDFIASTSFLGCTSGEASEVEQEYENILEYLASGSEAFYGINLDPKNATARLRLKEFPLHVRSVLNPHLGRSPGINVPSLYAGLKGSCSAMHCEDGDLDSGNIHRYGAPKYWLFVHPHYNHHLRQRVLEAIRKSSKKDLTRNGSPAVALLSIINDCSSHRVFFVNGAYPSKSMFSSRASSFTFAMGSTIKL